MNLLGLDTSTAATAACVLRSDGEVFEVLPSAEALGAPPAHATALLPAAARVLGEAGLDWRELDAVAVGCGPGGFTGLRIGIATARGIALAHGLELRPVSSLAALAAGAGEALVLAAIDARRGQVFAALHAVSEERWSPFAATPDEVAERIREAGIAPLAVGDGALRFGGVLEAAGARIAGPGLHVVRALQVCRLGAVAPPLPPEAVLPTYLRPPDAKPAT